MAERPASWLLPRSPQNPANAIRLAPLVIGRGPSGDCGVRAESAKLEYELQLDHPQGLELELELELQSGC